MGDVRHSLRLIRQAPLLAAVVIASLGVGIGVNTTVFSWVQAIVLSPLPGVADAGRFHLIEPRAETGSYPGVSWLEYGDLRRRLQAVEEPLAFRMVPLNVGEAAQTERAAGLLVSGNYFSALGLRPAVGRFIRSDEVAVPGGPAVVVISHGYWKTRFGGAAAALGQTLRVNNHTVTIVGVAPERFQGTVMGLDFDLWLPATLAPVVLNGSRELEDRSQRGYSVLARLRPGATRGQAQAELAGSMRELAEAFPATNTGMTGEVLPFWQAPRGPQRLMAESLMLLQGIMLLLLLAVCGNTANLMLARASARQREFGVRLALGASRFRIVGLLLTESLVLALPAAALGAAIAFWGTNALRAVPFITTFPIRFQTGVDAAGLAFALALGVASGIIFGVAPAWHLASADPQSALRAGAKAAGRSTARNALMGAQVMLALLVLMAAGLFVRSFGETRSTDPGFRREGVLLASYDRSSRNPDAGQSREFAARLLERLRALPGVESAAIATAVPLDIHGLPMRGFTLEGRVQDDARPDRALSNLVTPGYFATMGIPLVAGRDFADLPDATAPAQAIVNAEFVRRFVEDREPIGRRIRVRGMDLVVAGVVRNSISESFGEPPTPVVYLSYRDRPSSGGEIHVRTRPGTETLLAPEIQRIVRDLDPALPVYDVRTLTDHVEKNLFLRRIPARMFVVLGPLLLLLAAIGIYAVVDFTVSRRTAEIGIRLALGATAARVVRQIVGESMRVVAAGALTGWAIALFVATHLLRDAVHLSVFAGVPAVLMTVAAFACWIPARRAVTLDPIAALRHE